MIEFTSALYLGIAHDSRSLGSWTRLTTGAPSALIQPTGAPELAGAVARFLGTARATIAPSTLHLFWDLFAVLCRQPTVIHYDESLYPVAQWGIERVRANGVLTSRFPHFDVEWLRWQLRRFAQDGCRPIVVADGFCPSCSRPAPLAQYLEAVRAHGGLLVIDDTQALGLFGAGPGPGVPFGRGGGGSLRALGVAGDDVVVAASLAKAFGAPLAVLGGSRGVVQGFEDEGETPVHCSPASVPVLRAARRALSINERDGETLRARLTQRIRSFQDGLRRIGLRPRSGVFPVQRLGPLPGVPARRLWRRLADAGIRTVLQRGACGTQDVSVTFVLTAAHSARDVDRGIARLAQAIEAEAARQPLSREALAHAQVRSLELDHFLGGELS